MAYRGYKIQRVFVECCKAAPVVFGVGFLSLKLENELHRLYYGLKCRWYAIHQVMLIMNQRHMALQSSFVLDLLNVL